MSTNLAQCANGDDSATPSSTAAPKPLGPSPAQAKDGAPPSTTSSSSKTSTQPWSRIDLHDVTCVGTQRFLKHTDLSSLLSSAIDNVRTVLDPHNTHGLAPVRSLSLIIRSLDGVAYTTGKDFDFEHKEIHLSSDYLSQIDIERCTHEILGVVTHETVHAFQFNGRDTCPGGLIEGIADYVRLKSSLAPPHWKRVVKDRKWDSGYETTAYFLEWLESRYGEGFVRKLNQVLREKYDEEKFWRGLCKGRTVGELWGRYERAVEAEEEEREEEGSDGEDEWGKGQ